MNNRLLLSLIGLLAFTTPVAQAHANSTRVIELSGGQNFRDLGGYPGADGKTVKWGKLFRSSELNHLTAEDYQTISSLGIKLVCDLRSVQERASAPTVWTAEPAALTIASNYSMDLTRFAEAMSRPDISPAQVEAMMRESYKTSAYRLEPQLRVLFSQLANGESPVLWHCTAGKDRTGVTAALVLTALGVDREVIFADYEMSNQLYDMGRFRSRKSADDVNDPIAVMFAKVPPDVMKVVGGVNRTWLQSTFAQIEADHGTVLAYLEKQLGVTPDRLQTLRSHLLE